MLFLPETNKPFILESVYTPMVFKYCWMFNASLCDFQLQPINYLEETTGPAVLARINNFEFWIPKNWHILVTERETYQIDTVCITQCAAVPHEVFFFCPTETKLLSGTISIIDECSKIQVVHPMINKGTALIHPVGSSSIRVGQEKHLAVIIGPHDMAKSLTGKVVGDLI